MIEEAIESGEITVYSSYPIEQGVFVSPSYMEAASYSGDGNVYEKTVKTDEVAWIDPTQGMYANTAESYSLSSPNTAPKKYGDYNVYTAIGCYSNTSYTYYGHYKLNFDGITEDSIITAVNVKAVFKRYHDNTKTKFELSAGKHTFNP